jgi:hypothetical protein
MQRMSNFEIPSKIDKILLKLYTICESKNNKLLQNIIVNSTPQLIEGFIYDNWNGGTNGHRLILHLPDDIYLEILNEKETISKTILDGISQLTYSIENEYIHDIIFEPKNDQYNENWRDETGISRSAVKRVQNDSIINRIWKNPKNFRLFLSHLSEFKKETSVLKQNLEKYNISSFIAHEDITATKEWQDEIENALFSADALLAIMTDKFHASKWTDQEIGIAIGRGIPVISVRLGTDPYGFIGKYQAIKRIDLEKEFSEIVGCMLKVSSKMVDVFINQFENSSSYTDTMQSVTLLNYIENLNDYQVNRLLNAYKTNDQIYKCWYTKGFKNTKGLFAELERITKKKYNPEDYKNEIY